jgi:hypothetical protein
MSRRPRIPQVADSKSRARGDEALPGVEVGGDRGAGLLADLRATGGAIVLAGAADRVSGLDEEALNVLDVEEAGAVDELVAHAHGQDHVRVEGGGLGAIGGRGGEVFHEGVH